MGKSIRLIRAVTLVICTATLVGCAVVSQAQTEVNQPSQVEIVRETQVVETPVVQEQQPLQILPVAVLISEKFLVPMSLASRIVDLSTKYAYDDFPTREDILAIVAVESGFRPKAAFKGSYGLMQIERKSHGNKLNGKNLLDPGVNIELGSAILNEYYLLLGRNKKAAILAYNAGVGNYLKHKVRLKYYQKFLTAKAKLTQSNTN